MRKILFLLVLTASYTRAQDKLLTVEDAVMKQRNELAPKTLKQLTWAPGSHNYSYVNDNVLYVTDAEKGKNLYTLPLKTLNAGLKKEKADTVASLSGITWKSAHSVAIGSREYDLATKKFSPLSFAGLPTDAENKDEHKASGRIAYTVKNNLHMWSNGKNLVVTKDENENIVNGKSVHREEFGIFKGTFWSPKGNLLAFYRMDQTMVNDYPIVDFSAAPAKNNNIKYPMAGGTSHEVTVGVYDPQKQSTVFLKTGGPKDHYLTNIAWSPDETTVYIAELNRDQNHLQLNSYNAATGDFIKTLFEEKDEKYVQPLHPLEFIDDTRFTWQSERDGHNHLYLYDTSGKLLRQLTSGSWEVLETKGFNRKLNRFFFSASAESPLDKDLYSVDPDKGQMQRISSGKGVHHTTLDDNLEYALDNFSSTAVPREISVISLSSGSKKILLTAENPLKDYKTGEISIFTIKASDNTDLYCRLVKPAGFDPAKTYPAIVYVYGGPGVQLITNSWLGGSDLWYQYMAEKGFVLLTVDSRGSEGRGKAFEQATFRQLGTVEMEDQLKGVEYLKSLSYVDQKRLGVYGWSFGGFMTTSLMTRNPGVFKAAVAGGPVIDWSYYEVMYTERYMDTPQNNKKGYEESNLLNYAQNLKGRLLMIHGTSDDIVVWQHSLMFAKKCVDKGVPLDYFVYPGHLHNVTGKDRVHLITKISDYFIEHL